MFLRGLGSRVLELGGESGTDRHPTVYPGSYVEYVQKLGHVRRLGSIRWPCRAFVQRLAGRLSKLSSQPDTTWQRR